MARRLIRSNRRTQVRLWRVYRFPWQGQTPVHIVISISKNKFVTFLHNEHAYKGSINFLSIRTTKIFFSAAHIRPLLLEGEGVKA